jgi:predicted Zn-dependent protease with MMP-like domain
MLEMTRFRFAELVDDAIDSLPDALLGLLDNVIVRIADRDEGDGKLLGLYEGIALTDRGHDYSFAVPDTITIFRTAILAICVDDAQVAHEVAVTVVHEIGHHFGIEEHRLHELGWG